MLGQEELGVMPPVLEHSPMAQRQHSTMEVTALESTSVPP